MPVQTVVLKSQSGIKRDGTRFEGDFYVDGQWVRWHGRLSGYAKILAGNQPGLFNLHPDELRLLSFRRGEYAG